MPTFILKHIAREEPGLITEVLDTHRLPYRIVEFERGRAFPERLEDTSALFLMGGPQSANDENPDMLREREFVRLAIARGTPVFGVCLGLQIMVAALGGRVIRMRDMPGRLEKEVGFRDPAEGDLFQVLLTKRGKNDPLLAGVAEEFAVFQLHGEKVLPAPGMTLLGLGAFCLQQIVRVGPKAYGLQPHIELTRPLLERWLREDPDLKPLDAAAVLADYEKIEDEYAARGRRIIENFLRIAGLI
ncbi:MAG: type 1 glutamine amidotransferase [bacterium]|nr:type 1 glutamine amidotransferase [bacterium]MDZ4296189.1 type 1 glutamine amidotransferase [Patescibacteria group bacterium]